MGRPAFLRERWPSSVYHAAYDERQRDRQALAGSLRPEARRRRARASAAGAGQGHHAGRIDAARSPGAGRGRARGAPAPDRPVDPPGDQRFSRVGKVDVHRGPGTVPDRPGTPGRGPGGGSLQLPLGRLDPGRQDADGAALPGAQLVHPPLAVAAGRSAEWRRRPARRCWSARRPAST